MDKTPQPCKNCESTNFEYDEDQCRNICLQCNTMQEMTGIGIVSAEPEIGVNYRGLQSIKAKRSRKESKYSTLRKRIKNMKPFKLEDMFHWIFERQVEALRPYVNDWDSFKSFSEVLWVLYMKFSGSGFDIASANIDDLRLKKYPLGWGVPLDPNRIEETLNTVPKDYYRSRRDENEESDIDFIKSTKNAKKLKIEKMVKARLSEKPLLEIPVIKDSDYFGNSMSEEEILKPEKTSVKIEMKQEMFEFSSESDESQLSDEDDSAYINMFHLDRREKNIVRVMRKKKESNVRYVGGRLDTYQLFMENNLILLFFTLHFTRQGKPDCCCLMDVWRLARRRDIPFLKIGRFLPEDRFFVNHTVFQSIILRDTVTSYRNLRTHTLCLAQTLQLEQFLRPTNGPLIKRLLTEFNLPLGLIRTINIIRNRIEPKIDKYYKIKKNDDLVDLHFKWTRFAKNAQHILFPELCCLSYIFMALRALLHLNGQWETDISTMAKRVEHDLLSDFYDADNNVRLFIWTDWLSQSYRRPTVSTAKTWRDIGRATSAAVFFEEDLDREDRFENTLRRNGIVNCCGRFEQPYATITHNKVLEDLMAPFEEMTKNHKRKYYQTEPSRFIDFTNSSVQYLESPKEFEADLHRLAVADSQYKEWEILDELTDYIIAHPPKWRQLRFNDLRYANGVFEELFDGTETMSLAEHQLIDVLIYNSGIEHDVLCTTISGLHKLMLRK